MSSRSGKAPEFAGSDMTLQLQDYRLTTAEILYHMPDYPALLQSFVWQKLDLSPEFPILRKFLDFWERNLDGRLHSVRVANCEIIKPTETKFCDAEFRLH
ncbi:MAG: usg protein [Pseudomonadota bacterium]